MASVVVRREGHSTYIDVHVDPHMEPGAVCVLSICNEYADTFLDLDREHVRQLIRCLQEYA